MERLVLWHRLVPAPRDRGGDLDRHGAWTGSVARRLQDAGGSVTTILGTSVVAEMDVTDLGQGLHTALAILAEAERLEPPLKVSFGAAVGELRDVASAHDGAAAGGFRTGAAFDRAMLLANRARPGELVLDMTAREHAARDYLFSRQVAAGVGTVRGQCVDRTHPTRSACRPAIRHLRAPALPPSAREVLRPVRELAGSPGVDRVVLRGPIGAGAREWIDTLELELAPPLALRLDAVPGSLEPLGSLRLAILRAWGSSMAAALTLQAHGVDDASAKTFTAIARGHAPDREDAIAALRAVLCAHGAGGERPWVVLDPLSSVDPATVDVVAEATASDAPDCLVLARLPAESAVPKPFLRSGKLAEIALPLLRMPDARAVAESILAPGTGEDVARRVAVLGGATPLGVCEAARALIAAGDLVWAQDTFDWRVGPRSGVTAIPVESLLGERLAALEATTMRVLEAVCAAPNGESRELLEAVTRADGLDAAELGGAIEVLRAEALIAGGDPWLATSNVLRSVVTQSMPPARAHELVRFIADAMGELSDTQAEFSQATRGFYLAEGGLEREGAWLIIEAGRAALLAGFTRPAVRLAAAAVQLDSSVETRAAATRLSRASIARERPVAVPASAAVLPDTLVVDLTDEVELVTDGQPDIARLAVRSIVERDFEAVDRHLDIAIAEGRDRAAADRLRAMAHLARGNLMDAMLTVARSTASDGEDRSKRARSAIARALVLLNAGAAARGVREALSALAITRGHGSPRGEAAAMRTIELCFLALGREVEAATVQGTTPP